MEDETYIFLYRKLLHSQVFYNEGLLKVWIWCLLKATYIDRWVSVKTGKGETEVHLIPGQFIFGRKSAAKELRMNESNIRNRMKKLVTIENVDMQTDSHYSIITIRNWDTYQNLIINEDSEEDRQRTGKGQAKDTNNKDNKVKKVKKERVVFSPPSVEEVTLYCTGRENSIDAETFINWYQSKNWMVGKNKMIDWKAAIRTWESRNGEDRNKKLDPWIIE